MRTGIGRFFEYLAVLLLAGLLVVVVLQVVLRGFTALVVPWTEEMSRYLGVWMVFAGAVVALAQKAHIAITVVLDRSKPRARRALECLGDGIGLLFCTVVFLGALKLIQLNWEQQAVTLPLSVGVLYVAVAVSSGVSFVILAANLWKGRARE